MPVTITGIGFFDMPSHGKGAPANGIEIHPVLDIVFNPTSAAASPTSAPTSSPAPAGSPTPATPGGTSGGSRQLVADSSFEDTSSSPWIASDGVLTNSTKRSSHTGARYAWLGGYGKVHTDTLHQDLALPGGATKVTLGYWLAVDTKERSPSDEYDLLTVEVRSQSGTRLATLAEYSNLDAARGYERRTFNLLPFRGQTVVVWFIAEEDQSLHTSFLIDDVTVEID
jgi:xanthomonalisin